MAKRNENKEKDFKEMIAKLETLIIIRDAQVIANPIPHLQLMHEKCIDLIKILDDVKYALSPDLLVDVAQELNIRPNDINGEAYIRCNAALKILNEYSGRK